MHVVFSPNVYRLYGFHYSIRVCIKGQKNDENLPESLDLGATPGFSTGMACGRTVTFGYLLGKQLARA